LGTIISAISRTRPGLALDLPLGLPARAGALGLHLPALQPALAARTLSLILPVRHFLEVLRGVW